MSYYGSTSNRPPPYAYRTVPINNTSETICLIPRRERPNTSIINMIVVSLTMIACTVLVIVTLVPYLNNSVAQERRVWDREIKQRRLEERLRIKDWEYQWQVRREEEKARQEEWEGMQKRIRREEAERQERERLREEKWQQEEEVRQRLGLYWGDLTTNDHCAAYDKREYWAPLRNTVPYEYNWLKACTEIPNDINGRSVTTSWCYINPFMPGEVIGHWVLDKEPLCAPYWDQFKDKGCTAQGSRRRTIEAHLENIHWGEDGEKLCASAPHDFYGRHFDTPDSCANWGNHGIFGIWHIEDDNC